MAVEVEESVVHIENLRPFLPEKTQEELGEILAYWKKIKEEWEKKKKEFWWSGKRNFSELLRYKWVYQKELEKWYKYLDKMSDIEKEKFIEEYLYDDILYSGNLNGRNVKVEKYSYDEWRKWYVVMDEWAFLYFCGERLWLEWAKAIAKNMELEEWVYLDLGNNEIWDKWAKAIAEMKLREWVQLRLGENQIWDEWANAIAQMKLKTWVVLSLYKNQIWAKWAEAIAKNLELKTWVVLHLSSNKIWDEWAEAIAENMKLKEWVKLDLGQNKIWDKWAEAIMKNMELKEWVTLDLQYNSISDWMKQKLKEWEQISVNNWINCKVLVY